MASNTVNEILDYTMNRPGFRGGSNSRGNGAMSKNNANTFPRKFMNERCAGPSAE